MPSEPQKDVDQKSAEELLPLVYTELRRLAQAKLAKLTPGQTLQPTALVHEAYVRLVEKGDPGWENEKHFWGAAAITMRNILVDRARKKAAVKHGGGRRRVAFDEAAFAHVAELNDDQLIMLDDAITKLEEMDQHMAEIVRLRCFAGCTIKQVSIAIDEPTQLVEKQWRFIRNWLHNEMSSS